MVLINKIMRAMMLLPRGLASVFVFADSGETPRRAVVALCAFVFAVCLLLVLLLMFKEWQW